MEDSAKSARLAHLTAFQIKVYLAAGMLGCMLFLAACQQKQHEQLFQAHFEPYKDIISKRGAVASASPTLLAAMSDYNQQAYEQAIAQFQLAEPTDPQNLAIPFYLGVSYLAMNKPKPAAQHFELVREQQDIIFGPHAEWYLALAYLKAGKYEKVIPLLEEINRSDSHYQDASGQILAFLPGEHSILGETAATH